MPHEKLTDRYLKSLKPEAKPYEVMDTVVDRMGVRVLGAGKNVVLSFVVVTRFPDEETGSLKKHPTRRALGSYLDPAKATDREEPTVELLLTLDALTLAEARRKAAVWLDMIARGVDPADEADRQKQVKVEKRKNTFGAVIGRTPRESLRLGQALDP
jgi:Arm DNA-binding domain